MMFSRRPWAVLLLALCRVGGLRASTFEELSAEAAAARAADRLPEAIDLYKQALQLKPDWVDGWWYLGTLYYDGDRYLDGQQAFQQFVKINAAPPGFAFLGLCEFETGDYPAAREHLRKALAGALPQDIEPVARFHQALLFTKMGQFAQAWPLYQKLLDRGIHDPTVLIGMGLNALNKPVVPKEAVREDLLPVTYAGQAAYAWLTRDSAKAESAFHLLLTSFPATPGVHSFYATYLLGDRPEEAAMEFRRELEVSPHNGETRALLAILLVQLGRLAEAAPLAEKAATEQPSSSMAQYAYGLTRSDPRQAIEPLEMAEKLDPSNFQFHIALAGVYSTCGRNDDARRERKTAIQIARSGT